MHLAYQARRLARGRGPPTSTPSHRTVQPRVPWPRPPGVHRRSSSAS